MPTYGRLTALGDDGAHAQSRQEEQYPEDGEEDRDEEPNPAEPKDGLGRCRWRTEPAPNLFHAAKYAQRVVLRNAVTRNALISRRQRSYEARELCLQLA